MPNWVYNTLSISGEPDTVDALKKQVGASHTVKAHRWADGKLEVVDVQADGCFFLRNIVKPDNEEWYNTDSNWYDWNVNHWGTKWDVTATKEQESDGYVVFRFDSAWSPPVEALTVLGSQYPSLCILLDYEEEQGWGGSIKWEDGEMSELESYDIPTSHQQVIDRGNECPCEIFEDKVFDDCPVGDKQ